MKLISSIAEIKAQVPISMTENIGVLNPFLTTAENQFIRFMIGRAQFDVFSAAYLAANHNTAQIADPIIREAVIICQRISANLGYLIALPVLNVSIGASGVQIFSNADTKAAFQWQVEDLKKALLELGFNAIEELLNHLECSPDIFPEYINSLEYARAEKCLIENAFDFNEFYNIKQSRYTFQMLIYIMFRIEKQNVIPLFGVAFFDTLRLNDLEGKTLQLVEEYLKPGIALLVIAKASVERIITIDNGMAAVNIGSNYETIRDNSSNYMISVNTAADQLTADGNKFLQDGLEFLLANQEDIPGYTPQQVKRGRFKRTNDPAKGIFTI